MNGRVYVAILRGIYALAAEFYALAVQHDMLSSARKFLAIAVFFSAME
jgi:hypothetical protein